MAPRQTWPVKMLDRMLRSRKPKCKEQVPPKRPRSSRKPKQSNCGQVVLTPLRRQRRPRRQLMQHNEPCRKLYGLKIDLASKSAGQSSCNQVVWRPPCRRRHGFVGSHRRQSSTPGGPRPQGQASKSAASDAQHGEQKRRKLHLHTCRRRVKPKLKSKTAEAAAKQHREEAKHHTKQGRLQGCNQETRKRHSHTCRQRMKPKSKGEYCRSSSKAAARSGKGGMVQVAEFL